MARITILVARAAFLFHFNPPLALSRPDYAPYLLLWHQSVENQAQIQELQRELADVGNQMGGLRKDLTSVSDLLQRLEEKGISRQNTIKTLLEELSKMEKDIDEIRQKLVPENE